MNKKVSIGKDKRRKTSPWIVRWFGEPDWTGRQRWFSRAFGTRKEAEIFRADKLKEVAMGVPQEGIEPGTIRSFCKEWFSSKNAIWSVANMDLYKMSQRRLEAAFGKNKKLPEITHRMAELFILNQTSWALFDKGAELSPWSRVQLLRQCKTIFNVAKKWGHIQANPFDDIKLAKPTVKRWHRITAQQYHKLLEVVPDERWKTFYALAYTAGLRAGELLSLQWDCIDFQNNTVNIENREATKNTPPFSIKDKEFRMIPLPDHTMDILTKWHSLAPEGVPYVLITKERYECIRVKWQQCQKSKTPWRNEYMCNNLNKRFKLHCRRAGIKPTGQLSIHTLRKSCCQNWADRLPVAVTKELMGHSSVSTTLKFYNQVDQMHRQQAADSIQKMLEQAEQEIKIA